MDTKQPHTPTAAQILTNEELNRAHARMLEQWGEEAPDTRDEYRHPYDFLQPSWAERYED
jgi:hypothetical protein